MFEKDIKYIIDFTLNRVNKLGSFFTFEKFAAAEIHPAIVGYISSKLDFLIYEDRKKLLQNSSFDYSGSEIAKYFKLIAEEIKKNKRLAIEDVKTLVTQAVNFNINYLVTPNNTLSSLIFSENKSRSVNEIKIMLNYVYYYDYVRNVFQGYFSRRKILSLSEAEFGLILNKIDKQMFSSHTNDLIDNALTSIADFFNEGGLNKTRISAQTIELFLKEKNLMEALFKLRRSIPSEDKGKYDIEEIRKILYSKEHVKIEKKIEEEGSSEETEQETDENQVVETERRDAQEISAKDKIEEIKEEDKVEIPDFTGSSGTKEEEIPEQKTAAEDKIKMGSGDDFLSRYESELKSLEELEARLNALDEGALSSEDIDEEVLSTKDTDEKVKEEKINEPEEKESMTFEEIMAEPSVSENDESFYEEPADELIIEEEEVNLTDPFEKTPAKETRNTSKENDLLKFLSEKEIDRIVSNVFNEDGGDFVNTMEKISESATYEEATEILKAVFSSYKISPYSKDAVTLTNAVSNFFDKE
ncbi:MAG TPA: hypothetical protein VLB50_01130 [Ignavibacteriaceae bacterium]|nr:hypothetical protein [Ignavibacteriaceae bacterium]